MEKTGEVRPGVTPLGNLTKQPNTPEAKDLNQDLTKLASEQAQKKLQEPK